MAGIVNLAVSTANIAWNGTDAFEYLESITVAADTSYLVVRVKGDIAGTHTFTFDGGTLVQEVVQSDGDSSSCGMWILASPNATTANLSLRRSSGAVYEISVDTISAATLNSSSSTSGYGSSSSLSVTTVAGDLVIDCLTAAGGIVADASQTAQAENFNGLGASSKVAVGVSTSTDWTHTAGFYALSSLVFNNAGATPTIGTMDDPIRLGSTSSKTVSNFGSTINAENIARDGIQIDGTSVSDTSATWAAQAQNLVTPSAGTGATVTVGDGTDTANVTREFLPEIGSTWNAVGTVSGSLVSGDWGFGLGLESNQDAYITRDSDSAIATHNDDGTTTWLDYGTSLVYSWDKNAVVGDDGGWTSNTLTNVEAINKRNIFLNWLPNSTSPIYDQSNQDGNRPAGGGEYFDSDYPLTPFL